jgi:hypothetical protein
MNSIDTLRLSKNLQRAGMTEAQADGIAEALNEAQTDYATKQDLAVAVSQLEASISQLEARLTNKGLYGIGLLVLAQIGLHFWK